MAERFSPSPYRQLPERQWSWLRDLRLHSTLRTDGAALLFSAKSFAAAMLAYGIALRIGLPRPSWAIVTVYLVSQPSAGASLGRGVYRLAGTLVGAAATVAIIPAFVDAPIVCAALLSGWIGFCLFLSLLDRTARSYAFVLAGYTASLIGFPAVTAPGTIFDIAAVRVQEIVLGIGCAVLIHRFVLPRAAADPFVAKADAIGADVRGIAAAVLNAGPDRAGGHHRLAADLAILRGLATHLPYDAGRRRVDGATVRRLLDRYARSIPLLIEIEERLAMIGERPVPPAADANIVRADIVDWLTSGSAAGQRDDARRLIDGARTIAARTDDPLDAELVGLLAELVVVIDEAERLSRAPGGAATATGDAVATGYRFHRDPLMAARAAIGAAAGIMVGCIGWIWSAWADGGLAVSVLGVTCALFGNVDAPVPVVRTYLIGCVYGVLISLFYAFAVLPRVTDFATLVAVLAPAFLFAGSLQARPASSLTALGITLTIPILTGLGAAYGGDFAGALNSSLALFVGVGCGTITMGLWQTVSPAAAIARLLRLSARDVARIANGRRFDEAAWTALMIDRIALITPRLSRAGRPASDVLADALALLRIGLAAGRLRRHRSSAATDALLAEIAARFRRGATRNLAESIAQIDACAAAPQAAGSGATDPLTDLRFALSSRRAGEVRA